LLARAINSVLNQTYQNFELVIIDDGSTDNTDKVVESFKRDRRLVYHRFSENKGVSAAWNSGFALAKGDYIALLGSDDELLPEALEIAAREFARLSPEGVGVIWFDDVDFMSTRIAGTGLDKDGYISYEDHLCGRLRGDFWLVIEKSVLDGLRFDERTWDASLLWLRFYRRTKVFHIAKTVYLIHREHGTTVTDDFGFTMRHRDKFLLTQKVFLSEHGHELRQLCPRLYGNNLAVLGFYQILNGHKQEGRRSLKESLGFNLSALAIGLMILSYVLKEKQIGSLFGQYKKARFSIRKGLWLIAPQFARRKASPAKKT
jgi:glycosyltransferase involved in cell wall biosynthesis